MPDKKGLGLTASLLSVVLLVVSCTFGTNEDNAVRQIGAGVAVLDGVNDLHAEVHENARPTLNKQFDAQARPVSNVFEIGPSGKLAEPTTLRLPLNRKVDAKAPLVVLTRNAGNPWEAVPDNVTRTTDGKAVEVTVTHLSELAVQDTSDVLEEIVEGLSGGAAANAEPPKCRNEKAAREGYSLDSSHKDTLFWCFGESSGPYERELRVVNNRRYAITIDFGTRLKIISRSDSFDLLRVAEIGLKDSRTVLLPGEEVRFGVNLDLGKSMRLYTTSDRLANTVYRLHFLAMTVRGLNSKVGGSMPSKTEQAIVNLLASAECGEGALSEDVSKLIEACLSLDALINEFGWKGVLIWASITSGQFIDYARSHWQEASDFLTGEGAYELLLRRDESATKPFTYHGLTIQVPKDWTATSLYGDVVYVGKPDCLADQTQVCGPGFELVGEDTLTHYGDGTLTYDHHKAPFLNSGGAVYCPGTELWWLGDGNEAQSAPQQFGGRGGYFHEWRIPCHSGAYGDGPVAEHFTQRVLYLGDPNIAVIDNWQTPGLREMFTTATWQ